MALANLDMSINSYFDLVQRTNQIVQIVNEDQTEGYYSNGNVAVHGSIVANGNLRVSEANIAGNLVIQKVLTVKAGDGQTIALNVASGLVRGDGGLLSNIRSANLTTNNFTVASNSGTILKGGSAELGRTLFLDVVTSSGLSDVASGNVASAATANSLDIHIKTVHAQVNTIISTDLPSKQTLNTNLTLLSDIGPLSNGDIIVFANNRLERLPIGTANQIPVVQNNRIEYANALTSTVVEYFFESGFWNKPANFKEAIIYCIGGGSGGSGGGITSTGAGYYQASGGGGGVGIYYANNQTLASNVTVTIGAGGAGGNAFIMTSLALGGGGVILGQTRAGGKGSDGGTTSFGSFTGPGSPSGFNSAFPGIAGDNIYKAHSVPPLKSAPGSSSVYTPVYDGSTMPTGSSWGTTTGNTQYGAVIVLGGTSGDPWTQTSNSVPDIGVSKIFYGRWDSTNDGGAGDSYTHQTSGTGGILTDGANGIALPHDKLFISFGGCAGYPAWRSQGANGGNGIYGSGGGAGCGPNGNATNSQANVWGTIHTGFGGRGGDGYVVVISTIGRE